jgi:AcrR family transcriptional regulator
VLQVQLDIRLPLQTRSKESWERVLDSGAQLIAEYGYEGFTIAAVCERAGVAPRFIYDRVNDKETLFLAAYDRGMQQVVAEQDVLAETSKMTKLSPQKMVEFAVHEIGQRFTLHHDFLRNVVLVSSSNMRIAQRGARAKQGFSDQFVAALMPIKSKITDKKPEDALELCFDLVFSAWIVRTAYGREFSSPKLTDEQFDKNLQKLAAKFLLD